MNITEVSLVRGNKRITLVRAGKNVTLECTDVSDYSYHFGMVICPTKLGGLRMFKQVLRHFTADRYVGSTIKVEL